MKYLFLLFFTPLSIAAQHDSAYGCAYVGTVCEGDVPKLKHFDLYPNPTEGLLVIANYPLNTEGVIFGIEGRVWRRIEQLNREIDVSDLPQGVYLFRIGNAVQKFVKL
ncbi:MAG: T9SS type A sorting domain-containing protein [Saprospiraceae bacterium]|nr:T9SS type A sorting domain-containing protein [Saprospiraceae bacterium]